MKKKRNMSNIRKNLSLLDIKIIKFEILIKKRKERCGLNLTTRSTKVVNERKFDTFDRGATQFSHELNILFAFAAQRYLQRRPEVALKTPRYSRWKGLIKILTAPTTIDSIPFGDARLASSPLLWKGACALFLINKLRLINPFARSLITTYKSAEPPL